MTTKNDANDLDSCSDRALSAILCGVENNLEQIRKGRRNHFYETPGERAFDEADALEQIQEIRAELRKRRAHGLSPDL